jgi:hypothetical protein
MRRSIPNWPPSSAPHGRQTAGQLAGACCGRDREAAGHTAAKATRKSSQDALNAFGAQSARTPRRLCRSHRLEPHARKDGRAVKPDHVAGNYISWGVREFGMSSGHERHGAAWRLHEGCHQRLRPHRSQRAACAVRVAAHHEIQIVAVNDLGDAGKTNAHLTQYDTAHGKFPGKVGVDGDSLVVNGDRIKRAAERDPAKLPWGELGVDVVLECTGCSPARPRPARTCRAAPRRS